MLVEWNVLSRVHDFMIKEERSQKLWENHLLIADDLPMYAYAVSQIARNLRIVRSSSMAVRSLRFNVAVYRLIELGVGYTVITGLCTKQVNPQMRWFRVKRALCLGDSSCGLREFFL